MVRHRVFISYSHQDESLLRAFLVHLKPEDERGIIDLWTDRRIEAGQKWHGEIQDAIASSAVAVLLISPDFLASSYIREQELPPLLRAAEEGKLALACLHLRASRVADEVNRFAVALSGGETKSVSLTDYQALNKPEKPVQDEDAKQHDQLFVDAARQIQALHAKYAQRARSTPAGQRDELIIALQCHAGTLYRRFYSRQTQLAAGQSAWPALQQRLAAGKTPPPASSAGEGSEGFAAALYETLFGAAADDRSGVVLQWLFPAATRPTPVFSPVRIRILTADPFLAELPWSVTAWQGKRLADADCAWTFELLTATTIDDIATLPNGNLSAPSTLLLIAAPAGEGSAHLAAIEGRVDHAWPAYRDRPRHAATRKEIGDALTRCPPAIIYYYGPATSDGKTLHLTLADGDSDVGDLPKLWRRPPQIVFLNLLAGSSPTSAGLRLGTALAGLHAHVPLVIAQVSPLADAEHAQTAAQEWFVAFLHADHDDPDPIALLHQHARATTQVWARYGRWRYRPHAVSPREKLARLLLDRENQRRAVHGALSTLVHEPRRRLSCVLACGDESDLVHLFVDQLLEYLRLHSRHEAFLVRVRLELPPAETFTRDDVDKCLRRHFSLPHGQALSKGIDQQRRRTAERKRQILLLDWGARGTADTARISLAALHAWLEFCADTLAEQCPADLRLLCVLCVQAARERHAATARHIDDLRGAARFSKPSFTLEHLQLLDDVGPGDLSKFFQDEEKISCPTDLLPIMPHLIRQQTGGRFAATVELIEDTERIGPCGWLELYEKHKDSLPPERSTTPDDELL